MRSKLRTIKRLIRSTFTSLKDDGIVYTFILIFDTLKSSIYIQDRKKNNYSETDYEKYVKSIENNNISRFNGGQTKFVDITKAPFIRRDTDAKIITWYLPQYYQMEVNNKYHGQGFTEWTNSTQAIPLFAEHYQPHIPYDIGYYDLTNINALKRQAELAKMYGIYGFCFHWYWFSGDRTMEEPIELLLEHKEINMPFCFNWATENWTSAWDGGTKEIIFEQKLDEGDDRRFMDDMLPFMEDKRYIRIDDKPVLSIYRCDMFEKKRFKILLSNFRQYAKEAGFADLYIMITDREFKGDVAEWGADALVEFPPAAIWPYCGRYKVDGYINPNFKGDIFDLEPYVNKKMFLKKHESQTVFRSALVSFDNTARRATTGCQILMGAEPETFKLWLKGILEESRKIHLASEHIVFINSWNEWAEGSHLEPDMKYGYSYLQAAKEALEEEREVRYDIIEKQLEDNKKNGVKEVNFYVHCIESMGDVIACEPVARYLKRLSPEAKVKWIIKKNYVDIIKYNPNIDEVIVVDCLSDAIDICNEAKKQIENIIIDCHYDGRICSKTHRIHSNQNNPIVNEGTYFNYGSLLSSFCLSAGLRPIKEAPKFYLKENIQLSIELPKKYIVFHCKSAETCKDWEDNKWNSLAYEIIESGYDIIEIGFEAIVRNKDKRYHDCSKINDLQSIAYIIKNADCFVGIDSGFAHLANCLDVYGILIFGKYKNFDYPMVYSGKYGDGSNVNIIYAQKDVAKKVEVAEVYDAFINKMCLNKIVNDKVDTKEELILATKDNIKEKEKYIKFNKPIVNCGGVYGNVSYSQFGDDLVIKNLFSQIGINQPSFMDVGAHHPYVMSNTALLYESGSRGINVEADENAMQAFIYERNEDININMAIARETGIEQYYYIEKAPSCSTSLREFAERFISQDPQYAPIKEKQIRAISLDDLVINECKDGSFPDYLNINICGKDYEVLENSQLIYSNGPKVIEVEVDGVEHEKFNEMFKNYGYFFYMRLGVNEIYVRNKYQFYVGK